MELAIANIDSPSKPAVKAQWFGAAQHIKQQAEIHHESQRIQHQANKASIIHQNQMIKRKYTANRRLQQRLTSRRGTTSIPTLRQPEYLVVPKDLPHNTKNTPAFTSTSFLASARKHAAAEEANAIQEHSKKARKESIAKTRLKQIQATGNLQQRLALRQRAKQARA